MQDAAKHGEWRALGVACGAHALHDGYTDLVWVALPIWQGEFGLNYVVVGLISTRLQRHPGNSGPPLPRQSPYSCRCRACDRDSLGRFGVTAWLGSARALPFLVLALLLGW